jgi:hypothetical protein
VQIDAHLHLLQRAPCYGEDCSYRQALLLLNMCTCAKTRVLSHILCTFKITRLCRAVLGAHRTHAEQSAGQTDVCVHSARATSMMIDRWWLTTTVTLLLVACTTVHARGYNADRYHYNTVRHNAPRSSNVRFNTAGTVLHDMHNHGWVHTLPLDTRAEHSFHAELIRVAYLKCPHIALHIVPIVCFLEHTTSILNVHCTRE